MNRIKALFQRSWVMVLSLALLLTLLNFFTIYLPWIPERYDFIVNATRLKTTWRPALGHSDEFNPRRITKEFLLVDVSNDVVINPDQSRATLLTVPADNETLPMGPASPQYDIYKLTRLFKWLSTHPDDYDLVVCNLYLDGLKTSKTTDSLLGYITAMMQHRPHSKILLPSIYDAADHTFREYPDSTFFRHLTASIKGAVNEELVNGQVYRYQLSYEEGKIKTLPLLMLERINKFETNPWMPGILNYKKGDTAYTGYNTFIPEMLFTKQDFDSIKTLGESGILYDTVIGKMDLWQTVLRFNNRESYHLEEMLKTSGAGKKTIFIDAFEPANGGLHKTIYGEMGGGMVLLNIYYNLLLRENRLDYLYLLFTFFCFWGIAWLVLCFSKKKRQTSRYLLMVIFDDVFLKEFHLWALVFMTFLSSFIFDKATHALIMVGLLMLICKVIESRQKIAGTQPQTTD